MTVFHYVRIVQLHFAECIDDDNTHLGISNNWRALSKKGVCTYLVADLQFAQNPLADPFCVKKCPCFFPQAGKQDTRRFNCPSAWITCQNGPNNLQLLNENGHAKTIMLWYVAPVSFNWTRSVRRKTKMDKIITQNIYCFFTGLSIYQQWPQPIDPFHETLIPLKVKGHNFNWKPKRAE